MENIKIKVLLILSLTAFIFNASAQKKDGDIELKAGNYQKAIGYYLKDDLTTDIASLLSGC